MLYEYRSDSRACMAQMQAMFESVIAAYRSMGIEVEVELLGERPCMGELDPARQQALEARLCSAIRAEAGVEPSFHSSSTDCNIPFSLGIPAVCTGVYRGQGRPHAGRVHRAFQPARRLPHDALVFAELP